MITSQYSGRMPARTELVREAGARSPESPVLPLRVTIGASRPGAGGGRGHGCPGVHRGGDDGRFGGSAEGVRGGNVSVGVHRRVEQSITIVVFHEGLR